MVDDSAAAATILMLDDDKKQEANGAFEKTLGLHYHSLGQWMSRWSLGVSGGGSIGYKMPDSFPSLFDFSFQHHPSTTQHLFSHNTEIPTSVVYRPQSTYTISKHFLSIHTLLLPSTWLSFE